MLEASSEKIFRDRGDTAGYSGWLLGINIICTTVSVGWVRKVVSLNRGRDIDEVLIKKGWQYHNNHDSSYRQRLNDLVIWNI